MKAGRLVVKQHAPWFYPVVIFSGILVALLAGWILYVLGQQNAGFDSVEAAQQTDILRNTIGELERENGALRDKVALLDRSKQVDQQAYTQVDDTIKKLQEEILELREEVGFYRGIVSPEESSSGLRVERFKVDQTSNDRLYRYKLVITQVLKNHRMARGEAKITIEGLQGGEPRELSLSSVSTDKKGSLRYRFKYFQKFEGDLMLPDGFSPRSVMVSLDGMGKNKNIEKTFQWPTFGIEGEQVPDRGATS